MVEHQPASAYAVDSEHRAVEPFRATLREAMIDLDRKGVIGLGPPQDLVVLRPSPESREAAYASVDLNRHPPIFDRYLAQRCMDELLALPEAHAYLMALYADSSDVWHEVYQRGESQWR
jgi:DNA-binding FadR family transcriptional regulator